MPLLETLREKWPISAPLSVSLLLVLVTLATLTGQTWRWFGGAVSAPLSANPQIENQAPESPLPIILNGNLFGASDQANPDQTSNGVRPTSLQLTLRAAFAAQGGTKPGAIIEDSSGESHWYNLNQEVPGGARLHEVFADHIVLEHSGNLETLVFPVLAPPVETAAAGPSATATGSAVTNTTQAGNAEPIPASASPEEKKRLILQRLEELRNRSRT